MRTVLILNPVAGISMVGERELTAQENEEAILNVLRGYGLEPELYYTTPEDTGQGLATRFAAEGIGLVIAAGGDGTVHAVANGLIGTQSTLGIIPAGTMNNLAYSLNIPHQVEEACRVIAQGETHAIDVGKINDWTFLEVAGVGLEAALFPAAEEIKSPGIFSTLHGVFNGLKTLIGFRPPRIRITFDGAPGQRFNKAIQVTISNTPFYGAHLQAAPQAVVDDGLLNVVLYKNFSKFEYLRHAISIIQGRRVFEPKITERRVRALRIVTDEPVEIQADGVPHGYTPAMVTILPGALRVRTPEAANESAPGLSPGERSRRTSDVPAGRIHSM